jgi:hypothetical protein
MLKLGMKPITGVSRVTVKKSKNVINHSLRFRSHKLTCYVLFG